MNMPLAAQDQADGLRRLFERRSIPVLSVVAPSGSQGLTVANLATAFAQSGREVLVVDATRGEVHQALGLRARYELAHVVAGDKQLSDIVIAPADGLRIVPAARALAGAGNIDQWLAALAGELQPGPDLVLLHQGASLGALKGDMLMIATPSADAVTRAYGELKRMQGREGRVRLVVSGASNEQSARALHRALATAAQRFIGAAIDWAGFLPPDARSSTAAAFMNLVAAHDSWELPRVVPSRTAH